MSNSITDVLVRVIFAMSPKQKAIALNFFLWMRAIQAGKMKNLCMSVAYIAKVSGCSPDTVYRFLKEFRDLVPHRRRFKTVSVYNPTHEFFLALKYLDDFKILSKDKRAQKNWYKNMIIEEEESSYRNARICEYKCSNLPAYSLGIPKSLIQVQGQCSEIKYTTNKRELCGHHLIDRIDLRMQTPIALSLKKKLMKFPEQIIVEAYADCKWYCQNVRQPDNPYGMMLSRLRYHDKKINGR